jgi:hypothetical protein
MALDNFNLLPPDPAEHARQQRQQQREHVKVEMDIRFLSVPELMALRIRIDMMLGDKTLADVDLARELILQYQMTKKLFAEVVGDTETPVNQRVQASNGCQAILGQLAKIQMDVYDSDRLKRLEGCVFDTFRELEKSYPELKGALAESFLDKYRTAIADLTFTPKLPALL